MHPDPSLDALAVVLQRPEHLVLSRLELAPAGDADVVVDIEWTGISTGTERLLWSGRMPPFPGLGYPLVPGYESVGRVRSAGASAGRTVGQRVFVPGARCYGEVRGLFGGAASRVVVPGARTIPVGDDLAERAVLLALAATAYHAVIDGNGRAPQLVVGHGVLGRLIARVAIALGMPAPTVWERQATRVEGATGYRVVAPQDDPRNDYACIVDASGDARLIDSLIARLAPRGELVLAGFYSDPVSFVFAPAFMREARLRIAAEWARNDLDATIRLVEEGRLSLDDLITHRQDATQAEAAYRAAFGDPACLKMVLDWRACS